MMSTPASSQRRIWSMVAWASAVSVLVMVWTVIGESPPTVAEARVARQHYAFAIVGE